MPSTNAEIYRYHQLLWGVFIVGVQFNIYFVEVSLLFSTSVCNSAQVDI